MARNSLLAILCLLCLTCSGLAETLAFPALTGRVVDEAGLLSEADRAELSDASAALEAKTTDQFVVVTLKSLQGTSIEDYGYQLGRYWKIGQKDKDNGVLLIVAPVEHKVRIEVGYGLEGVLTDAISRIIIERSILPRFKANDFSGGIKAGAAQITKVLLGDTQGMEEGPVPDGNGSANLPIWPLIAFGVIAVGFLFFCMITGGGACQVILQILLLMFLSGGGGSSRGGRSSFSGGGGSFGGGGSSGSW